jgi:beta-phosphoglucomutase
MIRALIFDLDGTLVDTEPLRARSHAQALAALGPGSLDEAEVVEACRGFVGVNHEATLGGLMRLFGLEDAARQRMGEFGVSQPWQVLLALDLQYYGKLIRDPGTMQHVLFPHAHGVLRFVRRQGIKTALATMSTSDQAHVVLDVLGLHQEFDCVATCEDVPNSKPHPDIFLRAALQLHVPPDECLVLEDSAPGVRGALAAGMWCIAVPNDYSRNSFAGLDSLDPRWIVHRPEELARVVERMLAERSDGNRPSEGG